MANVFPKRWTETFQMRVAPEFLEALDRIADKRAITRSEALRALVDEEDHRQAKRKA